MRVTNQMSNNRMLQNINRNMRAENKYFEQHASGKKIQFASDDPIIASRALRFRRNVAQTTQYMRNVSQARSWMEISSQGIQNTEDILSSIRTSLVKGTSDVNQLPDREKILTEINSLLEQMGTEMNVSYGGRYVFSGYRTDEPPIITKRREDTYHISQVFDKTDIEKTQGFVIDNHMPKITDIERILLPYNKDMTVHSVSDGANTYPVTLKSTNDLDAYEAPAGSIHYIEETGELILAADVASNMRGSGNNITVDYSKKGVDTGDLNPIVYFKTKVDSSQRLKMNMNRVENPAIDDPQAPGNPINPWVYTLGKDTITFTDNMTISYTDSGGNEQSISITPKNNTDIDRYNPPAGGAHYIVETGEIVLDQALKTALDNGSLVSVNYSNRDDYDMENQDFKLEFGVSNQMGINNLAKDMFTPQMYADIKAIIRLASGAQMATKEELEALYSNPPHGLLGEELDEAVLNHRKQEEQEYRTLLHGSFNNLLGLVDKHESHLSTEYTNLGSKMTRLDFIDTRLEDDMVSYQTLQSENEDVNYLEVIMNLQAASAVYQASLKAAAQIMQISLADFI